MKDPKTIREKLGESQEKFWGRIGMSQSGGSRLETGDHRIHPSLQMLIGIVYCNEKPPRVK